MIAYLKGKFTGKNPAVVIIDVNGVGYEVHISLNTFAALQDADEGLVFTHLIVREDAHLLYGFADVKEKELFLQLISVSGIGANTARVMLSYMKPDEIIQAILHGDSRALERIKGIGKKTAERTVLELKDKIGKQGTVASPVISREHSVKQDALDALTALGINRALAEPALNKALQADSTLTLEALIKNTLKLL